MGQIGEVMTVNGEQVDPEELVKAVDGQADGESSSDEVREVGPNGFPLGTPIKEMTLEQQVAYFKFQNRKTEKSFHALKKQLEEATSESESAVQAARDASFDAGRSQGLQIAAEMELRRVGGWSDEQFEVVRKALNMEAFVTGDGLDVEAIHAFAGGGAADAAPARSAIPGAPSDEAIERFRNAGGPIPVGNKGVDMNAVKQAEIDRLTSGRKEKN